MQTDLDFHSAELALLRELFEFRDKNVDAFLAQHGDSLPLLRLTYAAVMRFFGASALRIDLEAGGE